MKKRILGIFAGMMIIVGALAPNAAFAASDDVDDGLRSCNKDVAILGIDPWYAALECDSSGNISDSNFKSGEIVNTIGRIVAVVVKDLLFFAGIAAVGLIMYGGFLMITSSGNPSGVEKGKKTISGAVIGLLIAILAYAIVLFILQRITVSSS